jgi:sulfur carrier protein
MNVGARMRKEDGKMIRINGQAVQTDELNLMSYLQEQGYKTGRIAVECNEMIIPKSQYETYILHSGDVVEIVSFVGGG